MTIKLFFLAATVFLMLITVGTKYFSTIRLVCHRERLHDVEVELASLGLRLKVVDNEKAVAQSNERNLKKELKSLER